MPSSWAEMLELDSAESSVGWAPEDLRAILKHQLATRLEVAVPAVGGGDSSASAPLALGTFGDVLRHPSPPAEAIAEVERFVDRQLANTRGDALPWQVLAVLQALCLAARMRSGALDAAGAGEASSDRLATALAQTWLDPETYALLDDLRTRAPADRTPAPASPDATPPPVPRPVSVAAPANASAVDDDDDDDHEERRGRYVIVRKHAAGGLGVLSLARDVDLGRPVALKEIRPELRDDAGSRERFVREAQIAGELEHPNIVPVYALGRDASGNPYYAMRFIGGRTLEQAIAEYHRAPEMLALRDLLKRFGDVCRAVAYAHSRGIVHRDLKPSNIMLGDFGETWIVDWGIAKRVTDLESGGSTNNTPPPLPTPGHTRAGQSLGTPRYMSPEQLTDARKAGPLSDIYSLGAILMEVLTGKPPHRASEGPGGRIVWRGRHGPRRTWLGRRGDRDLRAVAAVANKALSHAPTDRYATATDLAAEVDRWLADEPVTAYDEPLLNTVGRWSRRHRTAVVAGMGLLISLAVGLAVRNAQITVERNENLVALEQREQALEVADKNYVEARERQREAQERLLRNLLTTGDTLAAQGRGGDATDRYQEALALARSLGLSDLAATSGMLQSYVASPRPLATVQYTRPPTANPADPQNDVHLSRDGRTALVPLSDGAVAGYDVVTGVELGRLTGHAAPVRAIAVSADGRTAVTGDDAGVIKVWDRRDGSEKLSIDGAHGGAVRQIVISPADDNLALSAGDDHRVRVWDLATGARRGDFASRNGDAMHVEGLAFTPHGQSAISGTHGGEIVEWDLKTGQAIRTVVRQAGHCFDAPLLSPDGQLVLAGAPAGRAVRGWDFATGRARLGVVSDQYQYGTRDLNWPGQRILTADGNGAVHLWDFAGRRLLTRGGGTGPVIAASLADDGRTALAADKAGRVTLWDLSAGNDLLTLRGHGKEVLGVAVSPDGLLAASAGWDGRVFVWDVATGHVLRQFGDGVQRYWSVAFGPGAATVIAGSQSGMLSAWDLATGMQLALTKAHGDTITSMALSPDGTTLVTGGSDSVVKLWNAADVRQPVRTLRGHEAIVRTVAYSADGDTIVSGGYDASMILWDANTGARRRTIKNPNSWVNAAAFSPDERWILTGNRDGSIGFWEAAAGTLRRAQSAHEVSVSAVAFTPDGRTAASGGEDKVLRLWDVASGQQIHAFALNGGPVKSIAFTSDRSKVVWCSLDGTVGVLDFGRPAEYAWFGERMPKVTAALRANGEDPAALLTLGRWYAFRGADEIALELLKGARRGGAAVPHLTLARSHWRLGQWEHARAAFTRAGEAGEAPRPYVDLCLAACTPAGGLDVERATAPTPSAPPPKGAPKQTTPAPTPPKR